MVIILISTSSITHLTICVTLCVTADLLCFNSSLYDHFLYFLIICKYIILSGKFKKCICIQKEII